MKNLTLAMALITSLFFFPGCKKDDKPNEPNVNINPGPCDDGLTLTESQAINFAKALGICKTSSGGSDWGLVSANLIRANGTVIQINEQFGIMENFGANNSTHNGSRMVVMSTGRARTPNDPNSCGSSSCSGTGPGTPFTGIPVAVPGCALGSDINDDVGIVLKLIAPPNATGFAIDHSFFTFDYPEFVCTSFNDQFVILVTPAPAGAVNGHVALDSLSNPISVNSVLLQGTNSSLLTGTGFNSWSDGASTGWLQTTVPVTGGSTITLKFLIYDVGDDASDSSVLIDNFIWLEGSVTLKTKRI